MDAIHQNLAGMIEEQVKRPTADAPKKITGPLAAEQAALDRAGVPADVLPAGTPMPDGELLDAHGQSTSLAATRDGRPTVLVFYRGAWCPYCSVTLRAYEQQLLSPLRARGIELIAISPQGPDGSLTMEEKNELTFPVLSDPGNRVAGALGIVTAPTDGARASQQAAGIELTEVNADGTTAVPMPTVVLVDEAGVIRWIDVKPNYATRTEPSEILATLTQLDERA